MQFPTWSGLPRSERIVLGIAALIIAGAIGFFSFFADIDRIILVIKYAGLGVLLLAIGVSIHGAIGILKERSGMEPVLGWFVRWVGQRKKLLLVWVLCSLIAMIAFPSGNRVLMDEIVVLSTSKSIHEEREPVTPSLLELYNGIHKLGTAYIDKRPYLFATIVAIFHDVLGYSPKNAFYANMLLGTLALALTGIVGSRLGGGDAAGIVAIMGLTSVPLFCEHMTGGGIDVLNIFSILLVVFLGMVHLESPSPASTRALLGASVLLAYSRYESVLFLIIPVVMLALVFHHYRRLFVSWPVLLLLPSVVPLCGIHYLTFSRSAEWFQLADQGVTEAFSLRYVPENIGHALAFFLNTEHMLTNSVVVFGVGVVALLLLMVATLGRWRRLKITGVGVTFWSFACVSFASFGLLMAYSWGKLDQVVASRLSLPIYLLFVLSIAALFREVRNPHTLAKFLAVLFLGSFYWSCYPLAAKLYGTKLSPGLQIQALMEEFNASQPDRHFAVINTVTNFWLTRDVYSITPLSFKGNPTLLANIIKSGEFRRIYLIQGLERDPKTGQFRVIKKEEISFPLDVEVVSEDPATDERRVRVSLIKKSSLEKLQAPAADASCSSAVH